jgi:hypothetical protein
MAITVRHEAPATTLAKIAALGGKGMLDKWMRAQALQEAQLEMQQRAQQAQNEFEAERLKIAREELKLRKPAFAGGGAGAPVGQPRYGAKGKVMPGKPGYTEGYGMPAPEQGAPAEGVSQKVPAEGAAAIPVEPVDEGQYGEVNRQAEINAVDEELRQINFAMNQPETSAEDRSILYNKSFDLSNRRLGLVKGMQEYRTRQQRIAERQAPEYILSPEQEQELVGLRTRMSEIAQDPNLAPQDRAIVIGKIKDRINIIMSSPALEKKPTPFDELKTRGVKVGPDNTWTGEDGSIRTLNDKGQTIVLREPPKPEKVEVPHPSGQKPGVPFYHTGMKTWGQINEKGIFEPVKLPEETEGKDAAQHSKEWWSRYFDTAKAMPPVIGVDTEGKETRNLPPPDQVIPEMHKIQAAYQAEQEIEKTRQAIPKKLEEETPEIQEARLRAAETRIRQREMGLPAIIPLATAPPQGAPTIEELNELRVALGKPPITRMEELLTEVPSPPAPSSTPPPAIGVPAEMPTPVSPSTPSNQWGYTPEDIKWAENNRPDWRAELILSRLGIGQ